jgi:hypothetical protein
MVVVVAPPAAVVVARVQPKAASRPGSEPRPTQKTRVL